MIFTLLFLVSIFSSFCQIEAFVVGSCARSPIITNFDATRYAGRWYEIERSNVVFEKNLGCVTATYSLLNASTVDVLNQGFNT
jgi:lipocalin